MSRDEIRNERKENPPDLITEEAILQAENDLIAFSGEHKLELPLTLRDKVLDKIRLLNEQKKQHQKLDPDNLPQLDETSSLLDWQELTESIAPPGDFEDIYMHTLVSDDKRELFIAWVKVFIPEEVHHDVLESFLILEGSCTCFIKSPGGLTRTISLEKGDFITMKIGDYHNLQITSDKPAKAIIQWTKLAA